MDVVCVCVCVCVCVYVCVTDILHAVQHPKEILTDYKCDDPRCIALGCQFCSDACYNKANDQVTGEDMSR